jgi:hypothetical protein
MIPDLIRLTLRDARGGARALLGLGLPATVLWQALALVVVLSVIVVQLTALMTGALAVPEGEEAMNRLLLSPVVLGLVQVALFVVMVFAIHWVGRGFGGTGEFEGALAVVAWLQFLLVCLQVVQMGLLLVAPLVAALAGLAGVAGFFYLLTQFVTVLHGFRRAGMVFVMILVTMFALTFVLSLVLTLLGVVLVGASPDA